MQQFMMQSARCEVLAWIGSVYFNRSFLHGSFGTKIKLYVKEQEKIMIISCNASSFFPTTTFRITKAWIWHILSFYSNMFIFYIIINTYVLEAVSAHTRLESIICMLHALSFCTNSLLIAIAYKYIAL
jgi:hypothetical protein